MQKDQSNGQAAIRAFAALVGELSATAAFNPGGVRPHVLMSNRQGSTPLSSRVVMQETIELPALAEIELEEDAVWLLKEADGDVSKARSNYMGYTLTQLKEDDPETYDLVKDDPKHPQAHLELVTVMFNAVGCFAAEVDSWPSDEQAKKLAAVARTGYDGTYQAPAMLDVGCGDGLLLPFLYAVGAPIEKYKGIDLAERMIDVAKAQHNVEEYKDAKFEHMRFEEEHYYRSQDNATYDTIFFNAVLEFFIDPADAIAKAASMLTREPHARIVVSHIEGRAQVRRENEDFPMQAVSPMPSIGQLSQIAEPLGLQVLAPGFFGGDVEDVELRSEQFYLLVMRWNPEMFDMELVE